MPFPVPCIPACVGAGAGNGTVLLPARPGGSLGAVCGQSPGVKSEEGRGVKPRCSNPAPAPERVSQADLARWPLKPVLFPPPVVPAVRTGCATSLPGASIRAPHSALSLATGDWMGTEMLGVGVSFAAASV